MSNKRLPPPVHVAPAGEFTCDDCGSNTFFSLVSYDPENVEPEVLEFLKQECGVTPGVDGLIYGFPDMVRCKRCQRRYRPYESPAELERMRQEDIDQED